MYLFGVQEMEWTLAYPGFSVRYRQRAPEINFSRPSQQCNGPNLARTNSPHRPGQPQILQQTNRTTHSPPLGAAILLLPPC